MSNIGTHTPPTNGNGYYPSIFAIMPLPYRKSINEINKSYKNHIVNFYSQIGIPYGKAGRQVLSLVTTETIKNKSNDSRIIELGRVCDTFKKLNLSITGGKQGSISRVIKQFHRISNLHVDYTYIEENKIKKIFETHFVFARKLELYWNNKKRYVACPTLFENYLELSQDCYSYLVKHSFPIDLQAYHRMPGFGLLQDIYTWLVRRLFNLKTKVTISWNPLYEQFGPIENIEKHHFRTKFRKYLYMIKTEYYKDMNIEVDKTGITLLPSTLHIEKANRGYLV